MTEEKVEQEEQAQQKTSSGAWDEVSEQFQTLGDTLATAFQALAEVINDVASSPEAKKLREEAKKAAYSAREAGEQAVDQVRPQMIKTLRQVNSELQTLIANLEQKEADTEAEPDSDVQADTEVEA